MGCGCWCALIVGVRMPSSGPPAREKSLSQALATKGGISSVTEHQKRSSTKPQWPKDTSTALLAQRSGLKSPTQIGTPSLALENILDVPGAVQNTDNFDRARDSTVENDVATEGKALNPRSQLLSIAPR